MFHKRHVKLFCCTECGKKSIRLDDLIRHGKQVHSWNTTQVDEMKDLMIKNGKLVRNNKYIAPKRVMVEEKENKEPFPDRPMFRISVPNDKIVKELPLPPPEPSNLEEAKAKLKEKKRARDLLIGEIDELEVLVTRMRIEEAVKAEATRRSMRSLVLSI